MIHVGSVDHPVLDEHCRGNVLPVQDIEKRAESDRRHIVQENSRLNPPGWKKVSSVQAALPAMRSVLLPRSAWHAPLLRKHAKSPSALGSLIAPTNVCPDWLICNRLRTASKLSPSLPSPFRWITGTSRCIEAPL